MSHDFTCPGHEVSSSMRSMDSTFSSIANTGLQFSSTWRQPWKVVTLATPADASLVHGSGEHGSTKQRLHLHLDLSPAHERDRANFSIFHGCHIVLRMLVQPAVRSAGEPCSKREQSVRQRAGGLVNDAVALFMICQLCHILDRSI